MKKVEDYELVRKAYHVEGLSIREISRKYGHGRALSEKPWNMPCQNSTRSSAPGMQT